MNRRTRVPRHRGRRRSRTRLALLLWGLRHPYRLLRRYGFGWFQFAVLVVPVLLVVGVVVGLDPT